MRRLVDRSDTPPSELLVFRGRVYGSASEWESAFEAWQQRRERWSSLRGLSEHDALPLWQIDGDCPWDDNLI